MKEVCRKLSFIILVLGIIGSIILAKQNGIKVDIYSYKSYVERDTILTIAWFLTGLFFTAIGFILFYALSEILDNQERIHSKLYEVMDDIEQKEKDEHNIKYNSSWRCPSCGRVNASFTGVCGCGQAKPSNT